MFFQHENRFRYKFFDIVQFSRSCLRLSQAADDLIILSQKWFFVKLFFRSFSWFGSLRRTWSVLSFSALAGTFGRPLVLFTLLPAGTQKSFFCLSAWRSSIIPYAGSDVNTFLQVFQVFSHRLKSASTSCILQVISFVFYNVLYKGVQYRQWPLLPCGKHYFLCADCQEVSSQILFRKFSSIFGESYKTQNVVVLPLTYH